MLWDIPRRRGRTEVSAVNLNSLGIDEETLTVRYCSRQMMVVGCQLHIAGVEHGQLYHSRHFVARNGSLRIVDFTLAKSHECANAHPDVKLGSRRDRSKECHELVILEKTYGKYSGKSAGKSRWYD